MTTKARLIFSSAKTSREFKKAWRDGSMTRKQVAIAFDIAPRTASRIAVELGMGPKNRSGDAYDVAIFEDHPRADIDKRGTPVSWR